MPFPNQVVNSCGGTWDYWMSFDVTGGSPDVLLAGMHIDAYCSGGTTAQNYAAWYEWFPAGSVHLGNFPITAGDHPIADAKEGQPSLFTKSSAWAAVRRPW